MMNAEHRKLTGTGDGELFLFEGKNIHIEGYTPEGR